MIGNGFKLKGQGFRLEVRRKFLPARVLRPWHRVPREAVAAPGTLEVSKARLEQPGIVEGDPAHGRGWDGVGFKVPSNPNHSGIL